MGLLSSSKKETTNLTNISEETRQVNQQISGGLGVGVEGSSNVVQLTDGGAIQRTADVAHALVNNNEAIAGGAFGLGGDAISRALSFGGDALSFGGDTVSRALSFAGSSLNTSAGLAERALSAGTSAVNSAVSAAKPADSETLKTLAMYGALVFVALVIFMGVKK